MRGVETHRTITALVVALLLATCRAPDPPQRFETSAMGTRFVVLVDAPDRSPQAVAAAVDDAFTRIAEIDARFSDYDDDSEASRLGRALDAGGPVPVGDELLALLVASRAAWRSTDGAFDVTLGALSRLWRRAARQGERPPADELAAARAASGFARLSLDVEAGTARAERPGLRLDFGGIAKGFALDEALAVLAGHGITRALVDGGGDLAIGDPPRGRDGWRVQLADPIGAGAPAARRVLARCGVATSGDISRGFVLDGVRHGHLVDPRSGEALTPPRGASVIAPDATTADVWASALTVLGVDGLDLAPKHLGVRLVILEGDGVVVHETSPAPDTAGRGVDARPTGVSVSRIGPP